ncbi:endonuclease/exonuclease/phosphatase family protein [Pseudonocardia humida]|uniref:Endonuclease/exonuclease/phosphatase family protein n=1 Tax=Pseudonocardia humida TaxID=2800819 RepID=A0ABT0ZTW7_9PSEU|nr:endonuclease/exonuclease/phosphatase family protein [Pseudonocardia humida]MCO1654163.1 endonuclease/exonuclease/phosphatase family protein [Pseudonocardia humida]
MGLRIMTWNLWWRFGPQWRARQAAIAHTLRAVDPDVVALQEVWGTDATTQAHELARPPGLHAAFTPTSLPPAPVPPEHPDQDGVRVGLGLLSRWPITRWRAVPMPARYRDTAPTTLLAELAHPDGPLRVAVTCLEWEPEFDADRHAQAEALAAVATDPALDGPLPVLVAGDLNAAPDSPVLRPLNAVLTDAWTAGGGDPAAVTLSSAHPHAPLEAAELIDQRIDHVLVRPGRPGQRVSVGRAELAGHPVDGLDPSDHLAVVCDLEWSAPG